MTFKVGKLPPIRVGPHYVSFGVIEGVDAEKAHGMWYPQEHMIRVEKEFPSGSRAAEVVLHEVIHAVFSNGCINPKHGEEHIVSMLGLGLIQIIRDNPGFVKWLQATVTK